MFGEWMSKWHLVQLRSGGGFLFYHCYCEFKPARFLSGWEGILLFDSHLHRFLCDPSTFDPFSLSLQGRGEGWSSLCSCCCQAGDLEPSHLPAQTQSPLPCCSRTDGSESHYESSCSVIWTFKHFLDYKKLPYIWSWTRTLRNEESLKGHWVLFPVPRGCIWERGPVARSL